MKILILLLFPFMFNGGADWGTNFEEAKKSAVEKHQLILLNFSGSDWCGPCIRLHKEFFGNDAFKQFADSSMVLVNADFPRLKKNSLPAALVKQNESLADRYNPKGRFPFSLVLNTKGEVIKTYDGIPGISVVEFIHQLKTITDANNR